MRSPSLNHRIVLLAPTTSSLAIVQITKTVRKPQDVQSNHVEVLPEHNSKTGITAGTACAEPQTVVIEALAPVHPSPFWVTMIVPLLVLETAISWHTQSSQN